MKISYYLMLSALSLGILSSCGKDDNSVTQPPTPNGNTNLRGVISSNLKLTKDKTWTLRGYVYVTNNATLEIEPGTKIISKKDSAGVLIITKGAKINAAGTAEAPIVFTSGETSPAPGDLGGVILAGNATGNGNHGKIEGGLDAAYSTFGGTNDADNSGVLKYVRVEYAGKAVNPNDEVNGVSFYGVGSGTVVDHIQVTRGLDDAFEFFGGTFNAKYLVAYNCADDDFDFDDGYRGNLQFLISIKDPAFTDAKPSGDISNNIECDNTDGSTKPVTSTPITHVRISNATLVGPNNVTSSVLANYGWGNRWRRGAEFELVNSVIIGSQKGLVLVESNETAASIQSGVSAFKNNITSFFSGGVNYGFGSNVTNGLNATTFTTLATGVNNYPTVTDVKLTDPFNIANPKVLPQTGSPALTGAAFAGNFTAANSFDVSATYRGAMGSTDWATGWTVFGK